MRTKEATRTDIILTFIIILILTMVSIVIYAGNITLAEARVITEAEPEVTAPAQEEEVPFFPFQGITNGSAVRFRERPNTSSKIFEEMKRGSELTVEGVAGDWYLVSRNGLSGYVKAEYVDALNNK